MSTALQRKERIAAEWNAEHPVGTPVTYYPVFGELTGAIETVTTEEAYVLGEHTICVFVKDVRGCVALRNLEVIKPEEREAAL